MPSVSDVQTAFAALGGVFLTPAAALAERAAAARGIVFDWDGVFNTGAKGDGGASGFSEADSMGVNLLRFAMWRAHAGLPIAAIITGEENRGAAAFAAREHFHVLYTGVKNKPDALDALCAEHGLPPERLIAVFDDVNDLAMAARCGVRILVRRDSSPLLHEHVARRGLADYVTAAPPERHAVREAAELLLGLTGEFERAVDSRVAWDEDYRRYFAARQAVETRFESMPLQGRARE
ncbi:MAG TPA: phosphatase [Gammaproteobacteria bacterium]